MPEPVRFTNPAEPVTLLLHKPAGFDSIKGSKPALALLRPETRSAMDGSGIDCLARHFSYLTPIMPLEREATGLLAFTQDARLLRRMRDESGRIEEEFVVEVDGEIAPYGLRRLCHGLQFNGRNLPPIKVSWQNETRLRFALKGVQPGQIRSMCADVGLTVLDMKRIRIGRIPLAKLPAGEWRYLPATQLF
jgi:23S rRNA pseudouridine2604 synthase